MIAFKKPHFPLCLQSFIIRWGSLLFHSWFWCRRMIAKHWITISGHKAVYGKRDQLQGCMAKAMMIKSFPCSSRQINARLPVTEESQSTSMEASLLPRGLPGHPQHRFIQLPRASLSRGLSEQTTVTLRLGGSGAQDPSPWILPQRWHIWASTRSICLWLRNPSISSFH